MPLTANQHFACFSPARAVYGGDPSSIAELQARALSAAGWRRRRRGYFLSQSPPNLVPSSENKIPVS